MYATESGLSDQQYEDMKLGFASLWALVRKNRACLERLISFNREVNTILTLKEWDRWIDFQALLARFEPSLEEASLFLQELDAMIARNDIRQLDMMKYGQQLLVEMNSRNIKTLVAKFHKHAEATQKQVNESQAVHILAQIEAENSQLQLNKATRAGFIPNGDGTVTDIQTLLMWKQSAEGQEGLRCEGQVLLYKWNSAMRMVENLNERAGFATYSDWRLPTAIELHSLVRNDTRPTLCNDAFPNAPEVLFWSSTLVEADSREAWNVYFGTGSMGSNDCDNSYAVRLVRTAYNLAS
jgi:hypothetical protein